MPGSLKRDVPLLLRPTEMAASVTKIDAGDLAGSFDRLNSIALTGMLQPAVGDVGCVRLRPPVAEIDSRDRLSLFVHYDAERTGHCSKRPVALTMTGGSGEGSSSRGGLTRAPTQGQRPN